MDRELYPAPASADANSPDILGLTADSRAVKPGYLFAALPGVKLDGRRFIDDAVSRGAVAVLTADAQGLERLGSREMPVGVVPPPPRCRSPSSPTPTRGGVWP
jgi:UDP-N-acetylmuramoyl-L-alanyl-D-glutamate--2,6-diaminopimelate ligase